MTTEMRVALGRVVHFERIRRRWRQADLAERSGLQRTRLSDIEAGRVDVPLSTIERLAAAFGITPSELLQQAQQEQRRGLSGERRGGALDPGAEGS
ncbi:MAG TPA: helix-turn-helix transcriptional regulator [Candidatus Dormibacteraeota bacterium]|nr:helix-turn-helix transcriptional regulator [Candidatus Dormibacteraeota bacterium]